MNPFFPSTETNPVLRHAIVYNCPTPSPAQALIFGGGATGGSLYTPDDSLYLLICRGDIWNEKGSMGSIAGVRLRGTPGLFLGGAKVRQECRPGDAAITLTIDTESGRIEIGVVCLRDRDVIVVDIDDARTEPGGWSAAIENWHERDSLDRVGDGILETIHVNAASCYDEYNEAVGVDTRALGLVDPMLGRAWGLWLCGEGVQIDGELSRKGTSRRRLVIATACQEPETGHAAAEVVRACGRALAASDDETLSQWRDEHRAWWRKFWETSFIELHSATGEAEYEERLWYANMYAHACGMGGPYPMRFNGATFLLERDFRGWDFGLWGQNMRLVYYPMLAAGHFGFVREYIDWYLDNTEFVAAQTEALFGTGGLSWRETQTFWGADSNAAQKADKHAIDIMLTHFSNSLELCLLMEAYYRATGDEVFHREKYFPSLCGVLKFFAEYMKPGDDGKLHLAPAGAVETWPLMIDPLPEICGLHYFGLQAVFSATICGAPQDALDDLQPMLSNLPDIPIGRWHTETSYDQGIQDETYLLKSELREDGIYLPAAGQTAPRTRRTNMENAELYNVFPWGTVNLDSRPEELQRAKRTWEHRTWKFQNCGWAQDTIQLARLGMREEFHVALRDHASRHQRFPSGLFISPGGMRYEGLLTDTAYFDTSGVHLTALEEMLLQSYDHIIKLAPVLPMSWSGRCRLHSFDGFLVEARFSRGQPIAARITANRDKAMLLVTNHRAENMLMTAKGKTHSTALGGVFEAWMQRDECYDVAWEGIDHGNPASDNTPVSKLPDVVWPDFKVSPPHVATREGHWHDDSKLHGQVGLPEDGSYPATRGR